MGVRVLDTNMLRLVSELQAGCSDAEHPKSEMHQHRWVRRWWCQRLPRLQGTDSVPCFRRTGPQPDEIYDQGSGVPGLRYRRGPGSQEAGLL
jgi:hypothetical protein